MRIMSRYPAEHKGATRARILAASEKLLKDRGVDGASVDAVMRAAGMTVGGFYAHFASKDDLVAHAVTYMLDAAYAWLLRHTEGREPADALSNYVDAYLAPSFRDDRAHGCPIAGLSAPESGSKSPKWLSSLLPTGRSRLIG